MLDIICSYDSPNVGLRLTSIEFLVLHYTGTSFNETRRLFLDICSKVSAHFVITEAGLIYRFVPYEKGKAKVAWHAGKSCWYSNKPYINLNQHSLGIELVNRNGNVYDYTVQQYLSLFALVRHLKHIYPHLKRPESVLGHEHIAGFRGKVDPGLCFDWSLFFDKVYGDVSEGQKKDFKKITCMRPPILDKGFGERLRAVAKNTSNFAKLSFDVETYASYLFEDVRCVDKDFAKHWANWVINRPE